MKNIQIRNVSAQALPTFLPIRSSLTPRSTVPVGQRPLMTSPVEPSATSALETIQANATVPTTQGISSLMQQWSTARQFVERMGGIEGVLGYMTKFQKFMNTMQQMKPFLSLFMRGMSRKTTPRVHRNPRFLQEYRPKIRKTPRRPLHPRKKRQRIRLPSRRDA